jgi:hypothetical protein
MDELKQAWAWAKEYWYIAGPFVFFSVLGHWKPKEDLARKYPRVVPLVLIARDFGITLLRAFRPIAAFFVPSLLRELVDQFYHHNKGEGPPTPREGGPS